MSVLNGAKYDRFAISNGYWKATKTTCRGAVNVALTSFAAREIGGLTVEDWLGLARNELRSDLQEAHRLGQEIGYSLDKAILTLSGGALVFSMTFVNAFIPKHTVVLLVLFAAWLFFGGAIACVIFAMRMSQNDVARWAVGVSELLTDLDQKEAAHIGSLGPVRATRGIKENRKVKRINNSAIGLFLVGMFTFAVFVALNLIWR